MHSLHYRSSIKTLPPSYNEHDVELGNMSDIKFHKAGDSADGGYHDWEANAPHDPNHEGPPQQPHIKAASRARIFPGYRKVEVSVCHLLILYTLITFLLALLGLYVGLVLVRQRVDVHPNIFLWDDRFHSTAAGLGASKSDSIATTTVYQLQPSAEQLNKAETLTTTTLITATTLQTSTALTTATTLVTSTALATSTIIATTTIAEVMATTYTTTGTTQTFTSTVGMTESTTTQDPSTTSSTSSASTISSISAAMTIGSPLTVTKSSTIWVTPSPVGQSTSKPPPQPLHNLPTHESMSIVLTAGM